MVLPSSKKNVHDSRDVSYDIVLYAYAKYDKNKFKFKDLRLNKLYCDFIFPYAFLSFYSRFVIAKFDSANWHWRLNFWLYSIGIT